MKKIGILGGLAWPSTAEYYAGICRLIEQRHAAEKLSGVAPMPEMAIESLNVVKAASLFGNDGDEASWAAFDAYHRAGLQRLEHSGAEFAVIACNTAHHRFAAITRGVDMPVLNIIDVVAQACAWTSTTRVLILGTAPVMRSHVFRETFARHGIEAAAPRCDRDRRAILAVIEALQRDDIDRASKHIREIAIHAGAGSSKESTAVYLGCTELPLAFPEYRDAGVFAHYGIRYVNSTALHIHAAFECAISEAIANPCPPAGIRPPPRIHAGSASPPESELHSGNGPTPRPPP